MKKPSDRKKLARVKGLVRSGALKRGKAMKKVNAKRKRERFVEGFGSAERVRAIQAMPCLVCSARPSQVAHVKSRGAGGTYRDTVPLCAACHALQHAKGVETFERMVGLDLTAEAKRVDSLLGEV